MLLKRLKKKPFCNEFHLILFSIIIFMLGLKYHFILIFLILYLVFIFIKFRKILIPIIIIILLIFIEILFINNIKDPSNNLIVKISSKENNGYIIDYKNYKIKIIDKNEYIPGDIVSYELSYIEIDEKSYLEDFDYKEYLKSEKILYYAKSIKSEKIKSGFSLNLLSYYINNYFLNNLSSDSYSYVSTIVLSKNNIEQDLKEGYSILGISHILAISGFHIILLFNFLCFIFKKIFRYYNKLIPLIILIIYVISIGAPNASLRALLFLILGIFNEKGDIKYTKLDILSISFLIMVLIWPYTFYNSGFILSFLVSFLFIFMNEIIKTKYKLLNLYLTFILIYFSTLPIISSFNNEISILAILLSPILSLILSYIIIPASYIISLFPFLDFIFKYLFKFINLYILNLIYFNLKINIPSFNIYEMIVYYLFLILLIKSLILSKHRINYLLYFILTLTIIINYRLINPITKITFIDVGQGDSCLIELKNNKGNILIDSYNSFDFIKKRGINKIDYLILTHGDNDHLEDAIDIINYFNVKNIILNKGEFNASELEIISLANYKKINLTNDVNEIIFNDYIFKFLNTKIYNNENDNSNVIFAKIEGVNILFEGDASKEKENDILNYYELEYIDILKVAHHGSKSSSSKEFINKINPKISIISVGKNNIYNHPDEEVLNNLSNSKIYMTKDCGNITLNIINNKYFIDYYKKNSI